MTLLESLKRYTTVVADTGDIEAIARHRPQDATTNPSLLYHAAQMPAYRHLVDEAAGLASERGGTHEEMAEEFIDRLFVLFGCEILKVVPGRVSTEVAASLSFDTEGSIAKARKLISLYEAKGVGRERILIKLASTWEGIRAAERLEKRRHPLQSDSALQLRPGGCVRRSGSDSDFAVRRPYLRLAQKGARRRGDSTRPGPRRRVRNPHLQLLQEIRLQDSGDGRELPQREPDCPPGRSGPAHHQPGPSRPIGADRGSSWSASSIPKSARRPRAIVSTWMRRPSVGCITKTPWRPRSWRKASASSTLTPAVSRSTRCPKLPPALCRSCGGKERAMRVALPFNTTEVRRRGPSQEPSAVRPVAKGGMPIDLSPSGAKDPAGCAILFRASAATFVCRNPAERSSR